MNTEQDAERAAKRFQRHFVRRRWVFRTSSGVEVEMNFLKILFVPYWDWKWVYLTVGYRWVGAMTLTDRREVETWRNEIVSEWSERTGYKLAIPNKNGTAAFISDREIETRPIQQNAWEDTNDWGPDEEPYPRRYHP
jgi:hypothetical protein